jgi:SAM-dependent methyltransferase
LGEFTGERVIPGHVDADLLNEHLARYAFASRLCRSKRVLDAGCGAGYGSAELAKSAAHVVGADVSSEAIEFARQEYRLPNLCFEQASCTALPHPDGSFDLVVAFEVIEHLEDWRTFLIEVHRVLVPSGQLVVSTPNKLYYTETRERAGPNPFHVHEFEYREFNAELANLFPYVSIFLENHVEGVVFQPVEPDQAADVRIDAAAAVPESSHFFVAVCSHRPQTGAPTFVYLPTAGNVLREREQHIDLLEAEIRTKNDWLEKADRRHQELLGMFRAQQKEVEERTQWGLKLNRELQELQEHLAREQREAQAVALGYQEKVADLEQENARKTRWALETEARLGAEIEAKSQELAQCVQHLHEAEKTVEERTVWAQQLHEQASALEERLAMYRASRWVRLGSRFGLGPEGAAG